MGRISIFIVGAAVGAVLLYGAMTHHLVRTPKGLQIVPKTNASFDDSYVDVRSFSLSDWAEHRELVTAIVKAEKDQILGDAAEQTIEQSANRLLDGVRQ
jgi:hypothetical protein